MLKEARIGIAVCLEEGCSRDAVVSADILVTSPVHALDLLLNEKRLKATLRF
jgi:soluble P-type ATPase